MEHQNVVWRHDTSQSAQFSCAYLPETKTLAVKLVLQKTPHSLTRLAILLSQGVAASFANILCTIGNEGSQGEGGVNVDFLLSVPSFSMHQLAFQPKIRYHHTASHITVLSFLTQRGAHANRPNKAGHTALYLACSADQTGES